MKVVGVIIFVLLAGFVTWLIIDTTIHIVKRVKEVKARKKEQDTKVIDNTTESK